MEEIMKMKRDVLKPLLLRVGVAFALTFAGFIFSHFRYRRIRSKSPPPSPGGGRAELKDEIHVVPPLPLGAEKEETPTPQKAVDSTVIGFSTSCRNSADAEGFLLPEFNELIQKEFEATGFSPTVKEMEIAVCKRADEDAKVMEQEISKLRNAVRALRERERNLEIQLLEYYGLKEQQAAVRELQNRLKINTMEAQLFTLKIESLQADNQRLEAQAAEHLRVAAELDCARAKIKQLKRKMRSDSEQAKEQLSALHQRVAALKEQEYKAAMNDADVQKQLQRIKDLEDESAELRRANSRLEHENSELAMKLESTQALVYSVQEGPEVKVLEEANHLRQSNEDLEKEIERLRMDRCVDVEELVYLRWVNACLRYELRNYHPPPGKTVARDLSKTLSPKSEEKAKQLILEYANSRTDEHENAHSIIDFDLEYCSSSQASTTTDMGDFDDTSLDASCSTRNSNSSKSKFFGKLKRMVLGKDSHCSSSRVLCVDKTPKSGSTSERRPSRCSLDNTARTCSTDRASSCIIIENASTNLPVPGMNPFHESSISKGTQSKNDEGRNKINHSSQGNARLSLDIQRSRNLSQEEIKEMNGDGERMSDGGSSSGYKRMVLGASGMMEYIHQDDCQPGHDHNAPEKLELVKFAQALKSSRVSQKVHQKSASFSYF